MGLGFRVWGWEWKLALMVFSPRALVQGMRFIGYGVGFRRSGMVHDLRSRYHAVVLGGCGSGLGVWHSRMLDLGFVSFLVGFAGDKVTCRRT